MKIPFRTISNFANKITGVSIPMFGLSWNPSTLEVDVAEKLVTFLEDRRVLYTFPPFEVFYATVNSVREIRSRLGESLESLKRSSELTILVREMQTACREFLDEVERIDPIDIDGWPPSNIERRKDFFASLVKFRRIFASIIAQISTRYGIDLEEDLAKMVEEFTEHPDEAIRDRIERKYSRRR